MTVLKFPLRFFLAIAPITVDAAIFNFLAVKLNKAGGFRFSIDPQSFLDNLMWDRGNLVPLNCNPRSRFGNYGSHFDNLGSQIRNPIPHYDNPVPVNGNAVPDIGNKNRRKAVMISLACAQYFAER